MFTVILLMLSVLHANAQAYTDEILSVDFPASVVTDGTISIPCQWTTSTDRDMVLKVWSNDWAVLAGISTITVPAGSFDQDLAVDVTGLVEGDLYHLHVALEPLNSSTRLDQAYQFSTPAAAPVYADELVNVDFPQSLPADGTVTVPCQWTTSTDRDVVFKVWNYDWTVLAGISNITVAAGNHDQDLSVNVSGLVEGDLYHLHVAIEPLNSSTRLDQAYQFSIPAVAGQGSVILSSLTQAQRLEAIEGLIAYQENLILSNAQAQQQAFVPNRGTVYYYNLNASTNGTGLTPQSPRNRMLLDPYSPYVTSGDTHLFLEGMEHDLGVHANGTLNVLNSGTATLGPVIGTYEAGTGARVIDPARRATLTSSSYYKVIKSASGFNDANLPIDVSISGINIRMQNVERMSDGTYGQKDFARGIHLNGERILIEHCDVIDDIPELTDPNDKIAFSLIMGIELYGNEPTVRNCRVLMKDGDCLYIGGVTNMPRSYGYNPEIVGNEFRILGPTRNDRTGGDCLQITNTRLMDGGLVYGNVMENTVNAKGVLIVENTDPVDPNNINPMWITNNLLIGCDPGNTPYFFAPDASGNWLNGTTPMPQKCLTIGRYVNVLGNMLVDSQFGIHTFSGYNDIIGNVIIMRHGAANALAADQYRAGLNCYYGNMNIIGNTFLAEFDSDAGLTFATMDHSWLSNNTEGNIASGNFQIGFHVSGPLSFLRNNAYGIATEYHVYDNSGTATNGTSQAMPSGNSIANPSLSTFLYPLDGTGLIAEPQWDTIDLYGNPFTGMQGAVQAQPTP
ncbi:MAG TPA: hypothetical protein DCM28_06855 [Phycisphaerales bacterium]|nr:hypothetical protein [Phycisphaerales bacterium]